MRITIIGGTRFISPATAEALLQRDHHVTLLHRGENRCEVPGTETLHADLSCVEDLRAALVQSAPDCVVDTLSMNENDALIASQAATGFATVVLSSQDVYAQFGRLNGHASPPPERVIHEESPLTGAGVL